MSDTCLCIPTQSIGTSLLLIFPRKLSWYIHRVPIKKQTKKNIWFLVITYATLDQFPELFHWQVPLKKTPCVLYLCQKIPPHIRWNSKYSMPFVRHMTSSIHAEWPKQHGWQGCNMDCWAAAASFASANRRSPMLALPEPSPAGKWSTQYSCYKFHKVV